MGFVKRAVGKIISKLEVDEDGKIIKEAALNKKPGKEKPGLSSATGIIAANGKEKKEEAK